MRLLLAMIVCLPMQLMAQTLETETVALDPVSPSYLIKLTAGLLVVVAVIFCIAWLMKRLNLTQQAQNGLLRIVAGLPVGSRDRIVLLQVGDEQILVGLSPGRMEKLHTLSKPISVEDEASNTPQFAQKFNELMAKGMRK